MPQARHRRRRRGKRLLLLLAILVCVASIIDFANTAYQRTNYFVFSSYPDPLTGQSRTDPEGNPGYRGYIELFLAPRMQLDAAVALLASAVVLGTSIKLAKIHHRRKRLLLGTEAVVLTVLVVAGLQYILWERPSELGWTLDESNDAGRAGWYESPFTPHPDWPRSMTADDE